MTDWWDGGFPAEALASDKQRLYLQRRLHLVKEVCPVSETTALTIMGFDKWLSMITKDRASQIISLIKLLENKHRQDHIALSLASSGKKSSPVSDDACAGCGGSFLPGTLARKCSGCGKVSFNIRLR